VLSGWSPGRESTQHTVENAADSKAHVVFLRRCAPGRVKKIRNREFSDLSEKERIVYRYDISICMASAYVESIHMLNIRLYFTYAHTRCMYLMSDMSCISIIFGSYL